MIQSDLGQFHQNKKWNKLLGFKTVFELLNQGKYLNLVVKSNSLDDILQLGDFLCLAIFIGGFFNLKQSKSKIIIQAK